ncbi:MAG TPA: hydroxymethylpyrimidine/phosphomethylpyrimidine kinase [Polyangia bacterium]
MVRHPTPWPPSMADELGNDTRRIVRGPVQQASVLIIAGLDPSGGAGLLADAHVVSQHGFHVAGTVTALTEQDSVMCSWMHPTDPSMVSNQIARLIDDFEIRGVKIGMLANPEMAAAVARSIKRLAEMKVPIVVDPVLRATRGIPLLEGNAKLALGPLLELATVVTPNLDELAALTADHVAHDADSMRGQARRLKQFGPRAVLAKGGHLEGNIVDVLVDDEGDTAIRGERIEGVTPHGTGCALSSEIACRLAFGTPLREAVIGACNRVRLRIAESRAVGRGRPFLGL